jgi:hypothetical protein
MLWTSVAPDVASGLENSEVGKTHTIMSRRWREFQLWQEYSGKSMPAGDLSGPRFSVIPGSPLRSAPE